MITSEVRGDTRGKGRRWGGKWMEDRRRGEEDATHLWRWREQSRGGLRGERRPSGYGGWEGVGRG